MKKKIFPKISIVTPSYNQGKYIEKTILSILKQNYPNLEYIVIDGGSTDQTLRILHKYQKHFSYWVSEPDRGQSAAINKGFSRATGDILGWLNSDDILLPGSLQLVGELFLRFPEIQWITGQPVSINEANYIVRTGIQSGRLTSLVRKGFYHGKGLGFIGQEGTFWTRKLWKTAGSKVETYRYAMDYYLWKKFAHFASLISVETPLGAFRLNPNRKTKMLRPYYEEISPILKFIPRPLTLLSRIIHPLFLRHLCPRIFFDEMCNDWVFSPGYFFKPYIQKKI